MRAALIEADVNHEVVDGFVNDVLADSVGKQVTKSLKPGEEMIGIVYRRLIELLGGGPDPLAAAGGLGGLSELAQSTAGMAGIKLPTITEEPGIIHVSPGPTVMMMCGLQGSGKTTTCGKLAAYLKKRGRSVMLAAADLQRPAAVEQLETVAKQVQERDAGRGGGAVLFRAGQGGGVRQGGRRGGAVCASVRWPRRSGRGIDTVILDTAGRLHVNDELMGELRR